MAINPIMMSALKALSYADIDFAKAYKVERVLDNVVNAPLPLALNYRILDHEVRRGDHSIPVRVFEPDVKKNGELLLFFHGGGWVSGNIDSYSKVCQTLSNQSGRRVASVDYRLAPEHPFPAAIEDCYFIARELHIHSEELGIGGDGITIVGDSAGGNIAAAVSLMARDRGEFAVERQILIYPATHNTHDETSPFPSIVECGTDYLLTSKRIRDYISLYIQNPEDLNNPYFAPLLAKDLSNQPRTLIITAEYDPLRDEGEAYGEKLKVFGGDVMIYRMPDALHGFLMLSMLFSHVRKLYRIVNAFLDKEPDRD